MSRISGGYGQFARTELTGIRAAIRGLDQTRKLHLSRLVAGVAEMTKEVFERSQQYVPVDTEALKNSGEWSPINVADNRLGWTKASGVLYQITYGSGNGYSAPYAVFVHEETRQYINYTKPGTGAKFLERAVLEIVHGNGNTIRWRDQFTVPYWNLQATATGGQADVIVTGGEGF